jgi:hypothetical protein
MLHLITMPFRFVRTCRFALIILGALISGIGLWMQIKGVPPGVDPVVSVLRDVMTPMLDGQVTVFGMFSKIGGVLALLGLLGMTIHDIAPAGTADAGPDDLPEPAAVAVANSAATSTWQERLAAKTEPQLTRHAVTAPRSFGSVLRIGAIGAVICAFLAVLGATFLGNSAPGSASSAAVADLSPAQAMIQGHLADAGAISATGQPRPVAATFSIPKLDPTAIVPWVKTQLALALTGDQTAMITLGSIIGGIFVLLLGIKIMFAARRDLGSNIPC